MTVQASTLPVQPIQLNQPIRRRVSARAVEPVESDPIEAEAAAAESEADGEGESATAETSAAVEPKRGRGRPRKSAAVAPATDGTMLPPKPKRGRPAKVKVESAGKRGGPSKDDLALLGALFFEAKKNNVSVDAMVNRFRGTVEAFDRAQAASLE